MAQVPLHSLVITHGRNCRSFPAHELLSPEQIENDLVGSSGRSGIEQVVITELRRRAMLKLSLGERVVVDCRDLTREHLLPLVRSAELHGANVLFIMDPNFMPPVAHRQDQLLDPNDAVPVMVPDGQDIRDRFVGLTVIGDVHGDRLALKDALQWARARHRFVWLLGDIVSYGPQSLDVVREVYRLVMSGEGAFFVGNHERKIARWLISREDPTMRPIRLSEGNRVTVSAIQALPESNRQQWVGQFQALLARSSLIGSVANAVGAHGAIHPQYWVDRDHPAIESLALFGESVPTADDYVMSYRWVDHIPPNRIVLVGHDTRSYDAPMTMRGRQGGLAVFLDTGCGKGGLLSSADLRFGDDKQLRLETFVMHRPQSRTRGR